MKFAGQGATIDGAVHLYQGGAMGHNRRISPGVIALAVLLFAPIGASAFFSFKDSVVATLQRDVFQQVAQKAPSQDRAPMNCVKEEGSERCK